MTEVPPTRRTRKDAPSSGENPSTGAAVRHPSAEGAGGATSGSAGGSNPESAGGPTPAIPGSAGGSLPALPAIPAIPGSAAAAAAGHAATPGGPPLPGASDRSAPVEPLDDDPHRMPTAQLEMAAFGDHLIPYVPPTPPAPRPLAPWALLLAILGLVASLFTGWLLPLGVAAIVVSTLSLRRPHESRRVAVWATALAGVSLVFSVGWLVWGFSQLAVV